jgi:hypothetical protein
MLTAIVLWLAAPFLKSLRQRITTIPAGAIVVSVTVKPFDGV